MPGQLHWRWQARRLSGPTAHGKAPAEPGALDLPADELALVGELLSPELSEAHLRWLEAGAEGPDPCAG
jgi:hypothetical protein